MGIRMKFSFVCHLLATLIMVLFGVVYIMRTEFMPYHSVAVGMPWIEISASFQVLILALMKVVGSAFLANGLLVLILLFIPFKQGFRWVRWAIPVAGLVVCSGTLYATLFVRLNTPATPPSIAPVAAALLLVAGFLLSSGQHKDTMS